MLDNPQPSLSHADYTVACICPMGIELAPVEAMLDKIHPPLTSIRDRNAYTLGRLGEHNVVVAIMSEIGNNAAAATVTQLQNDFPMVRFGLLVGIGGGIPGDDGKSDVRLGDVVVSQPTDTFGGVVQYDLGKRLPDGTFQRTGQLNRPPAVLSANVRQLQAKHLREGSKIPAYMTEMVERFPNMRKRYAFPLAGQDVLFLPTYTHRDGISHDSCSQCDQSQTVHRGMRPDSAPVVHYGTIASANTVVKNPAVRDQLRTDTNALCLEMEAAGMMNDFPCLVIRGICDYADSHKNDRWQPYAAATAAAYMKELLMTIPTRPPEVDLRQLTMEPLPTKSVLKLPQLNHDQGQDFMLASTDIVKRSFYEIPVVNQVSHFVGRQQIMDDIHQSLVSVLENKSQTTTLIALIGMGGIGKTQIILRYCQQLRMRKECSCIFWISAHSEESVVSDLSRIAEKVSGAQASSLSQSVRVDSILDWFNTQSQPYLLVFDNYDDPTFDNLRRYVPSFGPGLVVITSRLYEVELLVHQAIRVGEMSVYEAAELLQSRSKLTTHTKDGQLTKAASAALDILGGIPLAIDQAGAYIAAGRGSTSLESFLRDYETRKSDILNRVPRMWQYNKMIDEDNKTKSLSIFTTWELSMDLLGRIADNSRQKQVFLALAATLGGRRVSQVFFSTQYQMRQSGGSSRRNTRDDWMKLFDGDTGFDQYQYNQVITELANLSLIRSFEFTNFDDLHFSIHGIVQEWIKVRLPVEEQRLYAWEAIRLLEDAIEYYESPSTIWPNVARMVYGDKQSGTATEVGSLMGDMTMEIRDHLLACLRQCRGCGIVLNGTQEFEFLFACCLAEVGENKEALSLMDKIHGHLETTGRHGDRLLQINSLRYCLRARLEPHLDTQESLDAMLADLRLQRSTNQPAQTAFLGHLSILYTEQAKSMQKQRVTQEIVERLVQAEPPWHMLMLNVALLSLPSVIEFNLIIEAQNIYDRAARTVEALSEGSGKRHFNGILLFANARLHIAQGKLEVAEQILQDNLRSSIAQHGVGHPETTGGRLALAKCLDEQGRWDDAVREAKLSVDFITNNFGYSNPAFHSIIHEHAARLIRANAANIPTAKEMAKQMVDACDTLYGSKDRRTLIARFRAISISNIASSFPTSFQMVQDLMQDAETALEPNDDFLVQIEHCYAAVWLKLPDRQPHELEFVLQLYKARNKHLSEKVGKSSPAYIKNIVETILFLRSCDRDEEGIPLLEDALRVPGLQPDDDLKCRKQLALIYRWVEEFSKAIHLYRDIVDKYTKTYGALANLTDQHRVILAHLLYNSDQYNEAYDQYVQLVNNREQVHSKHHPEVYKAKTFLAKCLRTMRRFEDAELQLEEVLERKNEDHEGDSADKQDTMVALAQTYCDHFPLTDEILAKGISLWQRIVSWRHDTYGKDHQSTIDAEFVLGQCLSAKLDRAMAIPILEHVYQWYKTHDDPESSDATTALKLLYRACCDNDDNLKGQLLCQEYLTWTEAKNGPDHEETVMALMYNAVAESKLGQPETALVQLQEVLLRRQRSGTLDYSRSAVLRHLAEVTERLGLYRETEAYSELHLELGLASGMLPEDEARLRRYGIATFRLRQGHAKETEEAMKVEYERRLQTLGQNDFGTIKATFWYAKALFMLRRYTQAQRLLRDVVGTSPIIPTSWNIFYDEAQDMLSQCESHEKVAL